MTYGILGIDTIQSSTTGTPPQFNDGSGAQIGTLCRAWVNFNGSTAAIRGSFNVTSVTRTATGTYTIAFTNSLPDANYSAFIGSQQTDAAVASSNGSLGMLYNYATASIKAITPNASGSNVDMLFVNVSVFR